ncbi:MAG: hypothetical protein WCR24_05955 [Candidatus Methanomethylophilaceae archaeon]
MTGIMRCKYCGKECLDSFCDDGCKNSYTRFSERAEKYRKAFIVCFILSLSPLVLIFFGDEFDRYVVSLPLIFIGVTAIVFPFATPETYDSFSIRSTTITVRLIGLIICIIGVIFMTVVY